MGEAKPLKPGFHRVELNKTDWDVPLRYQDLQVIGFGAYGQVCSAFDSENNIKVAIKKLTRPFQTPTHAKRAYREVRLLKHMNHDDIIGLIDLFSPSVSVEDLDDVYIVTQLMAADLYRIVKNQELNDDHIQILIYQILRGLKYVHSAGVIHRDLKPNNLAVNVDSDLKILDFGFARPSDKEMTGYVVARWYRAPEIMLNWMHYNQTVDVWSVGCIMAELLTGKPLFLGTDQIDQLMKIMSLVGTPGPELLEKITSEEAKRYIESLPHMEKQDFKQVFLGASPQAVDLLERMLDLDPDTRITAEAALAHPYLNKYADPSDEPVSEPYDQSFEDKELDVNTWKNLVFEEVRTFVPRPMEEVD